MILLSKRFPAFVCVLSITLALFTGCSDDESDTVDGLVQQVIPSDIRATNGLYSDRIIVSWSAPGTVSHYRLYRADSASGTFTPIADSVTDTAFTDTIVFAGRHYYYRVSAVTLSGEEHAPSAYAVGLASLQGTLLPAPVVQASEGTYTGYVLVNWLSVSGAARYAVYRSAVSGEAGVRVTDSISDTLFRDSTAEDRTHYYYRVCAIDSAGVDGLFSASANGYAGSQSGTDVPDNVQASDGAFEDSVVITWVAVAGALSYTIERASQASGPFAVIASGIATSRFADTSALATVIYFYRVGALVAGGASAFSAADAGYLSGRQDLAAPRNLLASDGADNDSVLVTWGSVDGATGYVLERSTALGGPFTQLGTSSSAVEVYDGTVLANRIYYYRVKALGDSSASAYSALDSGYAFIAFVPTGVTATDGTLGNAVALSWQQTSGAMFYRVFRSFADSSDTLIADSVASPAFTDSTVRPGPYRYRVAAGYGNGVISGASAFDIGYRAVSNREFFLEFNNTTIYTAQSRISLLQSKSLGQETIQGRVSGTCYYDGVLDFGTARVTITYTDFRDNYLTADDAFVTVVGWFSRDGTLTGTLHVSGIYNGTVQYNITITDEVASGGTYTVQQTGKDSEVIQFSSVKDDMLM